MATFETSDSTSQNGNEPEVEVIDCMDKRMFAWFANVMSQSKAYSSSVPKGDANISNQNEAAEESEEAIRVIEVNMDVFEDEENRAFPRHVPIVKLKVKYAVGSDPEVLTEHLLVKVLDDGESEATDSDIEESFDEHEVVFYTEVLPVLMKWTTERGNGIVFGIPKCLYAKFFQPGEHTPKPPDVDDDVLALDSVSTLVLEDLSVQGYLGSTNPSGLKREEVQAALRELAIFHATTWAHRSVTGEDLTKKFAFSEKLNEFISGEVEAIRESYPAVRQYLIEKVEDGITAVQPLDDVIENLDTIFGKLLTEPTESEGPVCLLHMELWSENLFFRTEEIVSGNETHCRILDWKHILPGSPTHDIACLLLLSLAPSFRAIATSSLLEVYWNTFKQTCSRLQVEVPYSLQNIQAMYKKSRILPLLLIIGSVAMELTNSVATDKFLEVLRESILDGII